MSGRAAFEEACRRLDAGHDADLGKYFTATSVITALGEFEGPKALAVGIKGIGKSAAFRYFDEFQRDADVVVGLKPERYALHLPKKDLHYSTCMKQFEYDLVLEALRAIKEQRDQLKKRVVKGLLDKAAKHVSTYMAELKKWSGRFGGLSILGCGFTLNAPQSSVLVGLEGDTRLTESRETLSEICSAGIRIRIVVDDPEQVFSASRELDAHLVGGFCLAALRLSTLTENLKVLALLKSHVYYPLLRQVDDLGKYPDHTGRFGWSQEELLALVDQRVKWAEAQWTDIFQGSERQARKVVEGMSREVRNGPRDLLRWLYFALQLAKGGKITKHHVEQSRSRMAVDALRELESSFVSEYDGITSVLRTVFGKDPSRTFTPAKLRSYIADLQVKDPEMMSLTRLPWMQFETSQTLPEIFLRVGALALESGGSSTLPYEEGYDEEHLETADVIRVVPAVATGIG